MSTELRVRVIQDPSQGFTTLPDELAKGPDITVCFDVLAGDRIRARLYGPAVPSLFGTEHRADLTARPADVRTAAARLCRVWKELLVDFRPLTRDGRPAPDGPEQPYASLVDLRTRPPRELYDIVEELALAGSELLFGTLLGGQDRRIERFREYLAESLSAREGLRVRFDSELYLPWPMVCLRPEDVPAPTRDADPAAVHPRFLGHRHQIEQTGGAYPWLDGRREAPAVPAVSLNRDTRIDRKGRTRAAEVAALLAKDTEFVERTTRTELTRALADSGLCEQLMYFWCHGHFVHNGTQPPCLALKLTDQATIDAHTVRDWRRRLGDDSPFQPFVMLNACHAGVPAEGGDSAFLGGALIQAGARGVLGPQIEMPQIFAAEYALEFLSRYLRGTETAGTVAHAVARYFADELHNPLGFAYALHCGMDTRLERTVPPTGEQEITV
ncbi:CHAT domain-containing protein [Streptomyces sp. HC44]|uniref:CHAT domain-containing protein n=1 Tax=Streptomyces scabichelini TaxID=2711217 RepID=A0A6G4V4G9_9ACTN|nr:CHAT domain-containing protein [Streptomyces scabichelini]NGO08767.1 CHAT domain-containing protein [Streptomyces scabichelini]